MNEQIRKILNWVFRFIILVCFILALVMLVNLVKYALIMDEKRLKIDKEFVDAVNGFTNPYLAEFVLLCIGFVLSILSFYKCKKSSLVVRSVFIGITGVIMAIGLKMSFALSDSAEICYRLGLKDMNLKLEDYLEGGYSMEKAEKLVELFSPENTAFAITSSVAMMIAIGLCLILFFILTLTSLHNLIKKKKDRGTLTYPETGQRLY